MIRELLRPDTVKEALSMKSDKPAYQYLAGGTYVYAGAVHEVENSKNLEGLIWTGRLGLDQVEISNNKLICGSNVTLQTLIDLLKKSGLTGALYSSLRNIANRNIRNIGTIGGNIASCRPSSDPIPALMVLQTKIHGYSLENPENISVMDINDYVTSRNNNDSKVSQMLLSHIEIDLEPNRVANFCKISRTANDLALISIAFSGNIENNMLRDLRLAAGCMGPSPLRLSETEKALEGMNINDSSMENLILENLNKDSSPIDDIRASAEYRMNALTGALISMINKSSKLKGGLL